MNNYNLNDLPLNFIQINNNNKYSIQNDIQNMIELNQISHKKNSICEKIKNIKEENDYYFDLRQINDNSNIESNDNYESDTNNYEKEEYNNEIINKKIENKDNLGNKEEEENSLSENLSENEFNNDKEFIFIKGGFINSHEKIKFNVKKINKFWNKKRKNYPFTFKFLKMHNRSYYYENSDFSNKFKH